MAGGCRPARKTPKLRSNVGYFEAHRKHTDYPGYRAKGWPIGSGITESAVKLFGKRVKGIARATISG